VNAAYRHLEAKTRIAELTLGQWAGILVGVLVAVAFAMVLRPFSGYVNLALGIYIGGLPAAAVFLASISEFDVWLLGRSALRFHRADGRYLPGGGHGARGYTIRTPADPRGPVGALDLGSLWNGRQAADSDGVGTRQYWRATRVEATQGEATGEVFPWP
jgi:hypothetical protein